MSEPFIGQVVAVGFGYAPMGWALCDGSLLSIAENSALFSLIGTTYGGDGITNFALPDLRGRVGLSQGQGGGLSNYVLGERAGAESVALTAAQHASHHHILMAANAADAADPASNRVLGQPATGTTLYAPSSTGTTLAGSAISPTGGNAPHDNKQPFMTINYIICLEGIYPSQS